MKKKNIKEEMAKLCYQARRVGSERKAAGAGFFPDRCKGDRATTG